MWGPRAQGTVYLYVSSPRLLPVSPEAPCGRQVGERKACLRFSEHLRALTASLPAAREALIHPRSPVRVSCTCDLPHTRIRRPLSILPTSQEELMEPRDAK